MALEMTPMQLPCCVGRYQIEGLYSQGGMSRLLFGRDSISGKKAIIKILLPKFATDQDLIERFINEGRILALSGHRNIVQLYECGQYDDGPYIAMEFISGTPLSVILKFAQIPKDDAFKIFMQICEGVHHLHDLGIVHGDIKPENILVGSLEEVKIIDFGIARESQTIPEREVEDRHQFLGTPFYMAPEVQRDYRAISFQSDIYSLGVVLFELFAGKISKGRIDLKALPRALKEMISRAMQENPQNRYQTVDEFIRDLESYSKLHSGLLQTRSFTYYLETYDELQKRQEALLQNLIPQKGLKISAAYHYAPQGEGLYFRSVDAGVEQIVLMAKSGRNKFEGISDVLKLHANLEAFAYSSFSSAQDIQALFEDFKSQGTDFTYSYFKAKVQKQRVEWSGFGYGTLFMIHENNLFPIGLSNQTCEREIFHGDRFLIVGCPFQSESRIDLIAHLLESEPCSTDSFVSRVLKTIQEKEAPFIKVHVICVFLIDT